MIRAKNRGGEVTVGRKEKCTRCVSIEAPNGKDPWGHCLHVPGEVSFAPGIAQGGGDTLRFVEDQRDVLPGWQKSRALPQDLVAGKDQFTPVEMEFALRMQGPGDEAIGDGATHLDERLSGRFASEFVEPHR